jgi:hypothetical protein
MVTAPQLVIALEGLLVGTALVALATTIWCWSVADRAGTQRTMAVIEHEEEMSGNYSPPDYLLSERGLKLRRRGNRAAWVAAIAFAAAVLIAWAASRGWLPSA